MGRASAANVSECLYVIWTLPVSAQILFQPSGAVPPFLGALQASLPGLSFLRTTRDSGRELLRPTVMVVLIFVSCGLLAGFILCVGMAFMAFMAEAAPMVRDVSMWVGISSPILAVALSMLLAGIVRTKEAGEPESRRLKATKDWLYLSPTAFFLICQALFIVGSPVG
ncbi:hypothetical protein [Arthrobacter sp. HLT1-20]